MFDDLEIRRRLYHAVPGRIRLKIPVDGMVLKGEALVDTSQITGRSQPELCQAKSRAFAGTRIASFKWGPTPRCMQHTPWQKH